MELNSAQLIDFYAGNLHGQKGSQGGPQFLPMQGHGLRDPISLARLIILFLTCRLLLIVFDISSRGQKRQVSMRRAP
jgi:hypothetical protein